MGRGKEASKAKIEVIEVDGHKVRAYAALPSNRPGELQLAFEDDDFEGGRGRRVVICLKASTDLRLSLATALLTADGAQANVKLTWPRAAKSGRAQKRKAGG